MLETIIPVIPLVEWSSREWLNINCALGGIKNNALNMSKLLAHNLIVTKTCIPLLLNTNGFNSNTESQNHRTTERRARKEGGVGGGDIRTHVLTRTLGKL